MFISMRRSIILFLICGLFFSCNQKKSDWEISREKLAHQRDSLLNTDVKLSFMGIDIDGYTWAIDSAENQGKLKVDSCVNGIYICTTDIPYLKDSLTLSMKALVRIGTFNKKVASIELITTNRDAFDFFKDTYCERYYDQYEEKLNNSMPGLNPDNYYDNFYWQFKNQSLELYKKTHKEIRDVVVGSESQTGKNVWEPREVNIADAICVVYKHDSLYKQLVDVITKEKVKNDSIESVTEKAAEEERNKEREKLDKEYKNNI